MTKQTKELNLDIDGVKFECVRQATGEWHCYGKIGGIGYGLRFPNSGPTHIFQHIENLVKNRI